MSVGAYFYYDVQSTVFRAYLVGFEPLLNSRLIPTKIKLSPAEAERLRAAFSQYWSSFSRPMKTGSENSKSLSGEPFAGALFVWGTELKQTRPSARSQQG